jgi:hypothetical protein
MLFARKEFSKRGWVVVSRIQRYNRLSNRGAHTRRVDDLAALEYGQRLVRVRCGFVTNHGHVTLGKLPFHLLGDRSEGWNVAFRALHDDGRPSVALVFEIGLALIHQTAGDRTSFDIAQHGRACWRVPARAGHAVPQTLDRARSLR